MSIYVALGTVALAAFLIWALQRLFVRRTYQPGPDNDWAQRNDLRKDDWRGPDDDFAALGFGLDAGGEAAE